MKHSVAVIILPVLSACTISAGATGGDSLIGMDSFALAAHYGTPTSYQILEDCMQLTYGSDATGCRLIVLIDQDQRVAGWATAGTACAAP